MLAGLAHGPGLGLILAHEGDVPAHGEEPLAKGRGRHDEAQVLKVGVYVTEHPGVPKGGAAYHEHVAAGLGEHTAGGEGVRHVAVADDRDGDGVFYGLYDGPVGLAGVELLAGAGVDGYGVGQWFIRNQGEAPIPLTGPKGQTSEAPADGEIYNVRTLDAYWREGADV